jgi:hypothetical protein
LNQTFKFEPFSGEKEPKFFFTFPVLADHFNDYARYKYYNPTINFGFDNIDEGPKPRFESAYEICKELNPCRSLDLRPLRDGLWIKNTIRDFKTEWSIIYDKFTRSGLQDGSDPYAEFEKYYRGNEIVMYAFAVFDGEDKTLNNLMGKVCPEDSSGDTSFSGSSGEANSSNFQKKNNNCSSSSPPLPATKKLIIDFSGVTTTDQITKKNSAAIADVIQEEKGEYELSFKIIDSENLKNDKKMQDKAKETLSSLQDEKAERRAERNNFKKKNIEDSKKIFE